VVQDLDLQGLLGPEMGEKTALGQVEIIGEHTDGKSGKSNLGSKFRCVTEDGDAGRIALSHRP
jgi:hypothetical protein